MKTRPWSVKESNDPFVIPSFETISFSLPTVASWEALFDGELDGWMYLSNGNPTLASLEQLLAKTQGTESCWVTSTGKSAIAATLLGLLNAGDHVILLREGYKSTRLFMETVLKRFGVSYTLVNVDDLSNLADYIQKGRTKLLVLESPTNPMTRVSDLTYCTKVAKEHNLLTMMDNSLAGFHQHRDIAVDVIVHSLSKYASGIGDVMGGAVMGSSKQVKQIKAANLWNSDTLSTHAALELWKGMQTYSLRVKQQASSALTIARYLEQNPKISRVLYPGLPSHPDHKIAVQQMSDFGSVLAFDVKAGAEAMRKTLDQMRVCRMALGTGFTQSLASPALLFYTSNAYPELQDGPWAIRDNTIRMSVGIETTEELIADFEAALV